MALDAGYRHFDTATIHRNETEIGRAVRDSGVGRENVFITTKFPPGMAGGERETIGASLKALGTDYIDLCLVHWPTYGTSSPRIWEQFLAVAAEGLVRDVGVSNYSFAQLDELIRATGMGPAVNQVEWGTLLFNSEVMSGHRTRRVILEGHSPFRASNLGDPTLARVAESHGVTPAQVVVRWHLEHDVVTIPKSRTPERIRENLDIFGFSLSADEVWQIDALSGLAELRPEAWSNFLLRRWTWWGNQFQSELAKARGTLIAKEQVIQSQEAILETLRQQLDSSLAQLDRVRSLDGATKNLMREIHKVLGDVRRGRWPGPRRDL